jgi:hypothetical protein
MRRTRTSEKNWRRLRIGNESISQNFVKRVIGIQTLSPK